MNDPWERFNEMISKLRERGSRITPQRMAILKILAVGEGHPSVEQIYECLQEDMPTISLATVYKTVALLKGMGEVLELDFSNDHNRYDGNIPYPHPHLICIKCGEIMDLESQSLEQVSQEVTDGTGYHIVRHRIDFYGICPRCQELSVN